MKKLILLLIASLTMIITGCGETKEVIKNNCIKTNLWVIGSGKALTRQIYDCSNINIEQKVKELKNETLSN